MSTVNMEKLRSIVNKAVKTDFKRGWQYRIEIDGTPGDWDLYCKESSHQAWDIETEEFNIGANVVSYPSRSNPTTLSLTMRDNEDGRIQKWFADKCKKVVNDDGTFNLPIDYLLKIRRYNLSDDGTETLSREFSMIPLTAGEMTESVDDKDSHMEFPITFKEFRSGKVPY